MLQGIRLEVFESTVHTPCPPFIKRAPRILENLDIFDLLNPH